MNKTAIEYLLNIYQTKCGRRTADSKLQYNTSKEPIHAEQLVHCLHFLSSTSATEEDTQKMNLSIIVLILP